MQYSIEETTVRYQGNSECEYNDLTPKNRDVYQYGCEFEFYIDLEKYTFEEAIDDISRELYSISPADILMNIVSLPTAKDKNFCMQIKPDISLQDNGIEISIPISSREGVKHYITKICSLIQTYGYTTEETGLHIHISTIKKDGVNFNFYKYMLLCDDAGLLGEWASRAGYSQNVMDILSDNTKLETRKIKTKKGNIWNLEKIDASHVEIKSMGGKDYHLVPQKIIVEFDKYADLFDDALSKNRPEHKEIIARHLEQVKSVSMQRQATFSSALEEAGIKDKSS